MFLEFSDVTIVWHNRLRRLLRLLRLRRLLRLPQNMVELIHRHHDGVMVLASPSVQALSRRISALVHLGKEKIMVVILFNVGGNDVRKKLERGTFEENGIFSSINDFESVFDVVCACTASVHSSIDLSLLRPSRCPLRLYLKKYHADQKKKKKKTKKDALLNG